MAPKPLPTDPDALVKLISTPVSGSQPQAVPVPGTERPNRTAVYRHHLFVDRPLLTKLDPEVNSMHDQFDLAVRKFGSRHCLGMRNWVPATKSHEEKFDWLTFKEVAERRTNCGTGIAEVLHRAGFSGEKHGVGLWCKNRPEWHIIGK